MRILRAYRIIALIAVIAMFASTATCFAFFSADSGVRNVSISEATGAKASTVVTFVGSEFELRAAAMDDVFNSPNHFSEASGRKIISLTNDIVLTTDMLVTADCALNLGSYNIDLNGHNITFRNGYSGVFEIIGDTGEFTGNGTVTVDMAHMDISALDSFMGDDVVLNIASYDETSMSAIIFDFVGDRILGGESRGYFYDVVDLPLHYMSFDNITLSYHSSDTSVLNDVGVVPASSGINSVVTITLDVTFESTGNTYSDSWDVHIITKDQTQAWATATFNMICDELSMYKGETSDTYYFGDNMVLPGDIDYPVKPSSVSYAVFNDVGGTIGTTCLSDIRSDSGTQPYLLKPFNGNHQYILNTNVNVDSRTAWLRVYSSMTGYAPCGEIKICILSDADAASATKQILQAGLGEDYENQFLEIELLSQIGNTYNYTQYELVTGGSVTIGGETVTTDKVEYVFEEEDTPYEIVDQNGRLILRVKESAWGTLDSETPDCFLRASFSYGSGTGPQVGTEYICVHYNPRVEQDFYPYYKQLDYALKQLKTDNSYTYQSFTMPAKINGKKPYIQYEIKDVDTGATDYVSLDHSYVASYNLSLEEYLFEINPKALTTEDKKFRIYYYYSFDGQNWSRYNTSGSAKYAELSEGGNYTPEEIEARMTEDDFYYTDITILGIVSDSSNTKAVPDQQLFNAMYEVYGGTTCAALDGSTIRVIPGENLRIQKDSFDVNALRQSGTSSVTGDIANLTGIDLLKYTKSISFRNSLAGDVNLSPLSRMDNLEVLNLGYDSASTIDSQGSVLENMESLFTDSDGDGWSDMKNLKVLWLDNNMIKRFYHLDSFPALEEVYVNGQFVRTSNTGLFFGLVDAIANAVYEDLYGSTGAVNSGLFASTIANGARVYNVKDSNGYSYSAGSSTDNYGKANRILRGIEYQETTANPLFMPGNGTAADRTRYLASTVYGKQQSVEYPSWFWFVWSTDYVPIIVPSSRGFEVLEDSDSSVNQSGWFKAPNCETPPELTITETQVSGGYSYHIDIARMQQQGATTADWMEVLDCDIVIKYVPFEEITYSETAPSMMLMSPLMMTQIDEFEPETISSESIYNVSDDSINSGI